MQNNQFNLDQHFKSVAILLHPNAAGNDYQLESKQLTVWLSKFDHWFKESVGIMDGERPYALYNRQVSLFGEGLLLVPDKLKKLATATIDSGYAISLTVDMIDLYNDFNLVQSLCDESLLSSIGVITDHIDYLAEHTSIEEFINQLVHLKRPIGLIGSVAALRRHNVLSLASINGTDITIYSPPDDNTGNVTSFAPKNPVKPCANRLQLYIDHDGHIYPCMGLLGLTNYALGHINDDISETALTGGNYKLDLFQLMNEGPMLKKEEKRQQKETSLPWVCEQHRAELLANE